MRPILQQPILLPTPTSRLQLTLLGGGSQRSQTERGTQSLPSPDGVLRPPPISPYIGPSRGIISWILKCLINFVSLANTIVFFRQKCNKFSKFIKHDNEHVNSFGSFGNLIAKT